MTGVGQNKKNKKLIMDRIISNTHIEKFLEEIEDEFLFTQPWWKCIAWKSRMQLFTEVIGIKNKKLYYLKYVDIYEGNNQNFPQINEAKGSGDIPELWEYTELPQKYVKKILKLLT